MVKAQLLSGRPSWQLQVKEDCDYVLIPTLAEHEVTLQMSKSGIHCRLLCLTQVVPGQKLSIKTRVEHLTAKTHCRTLVYASVDKEAKFDYLGQIFIDQAAPQTNSYLTQKTLVLDESAQSSSQPILEINNNNVQASHSASSGQINPAELFYLSSRGLSEKESKLILQRAFFAKMLQEIREPQIKTRLLTALQLPEEDNDD